MRHVATLALFVLGLLAVGIACGDGDGAPAATDTAIPPSSSGASCLIVDQSFCEIAETFDRAIQSRDVEKIAANTEFRSTTCTGNELLGACGGMSAGTELSGYLVGNDASDFIFFVSNDEYVSLLNTIAETSDPTASDEYGDGAWRLAAVIDNDERKVMVTTSIGADPVNEREEPSRRVFLFWVERPDGEWQITMLLSSVFVEQNLTGLNRTGLEGWVAWGED